jgi:hypothetical protein
MPPKISRSGGLPRKSGNGKRCSGEVVFWRNGGLEKWWSGEVVVLNRGNLETVSAGSYYLEKWWSTERKQ